MKQLVMIFICAFGLTACSSTEYLMTTRQGSVITIAGEPDFDEETGMYRYYDEEGREIQISKDEVAQIIER